MCRTRQQSHFYRYCLSNFNTIHWLLFSDVLCCEYFFFFEMPVRHCHQIYSQLFRVRFNYLGYISSFLFIELSWEAYLLIPIFGFYTFYSPLERHSVTKVWQLCCLLESPFLVVDSIWNDQQIISYHHSLSLYFMFVFHFM